MTESAKWADSVKTGSYITSTSLGVTDQEEEKQKSTMKIKSHIIAKTLSLKSKSLRSLNKWHFK